MPNPQVHVKLDRITATKITEGAGLSRQKDKWRLEEISHGNKIFLVDRVTSRAFVEHGEWVQLRGRCVGGAASFMTFAGAVRAVRAYWDAATVMNRVGEGGACLCRLQDAQDCRDVDPTASECRTMEPEFVSSWTRVVELFLLGCCFGRILKNSRACVYIHRNNWMQ